MRVQALGLVVCGLLLAGTGSTTVTATDPTLIPPISSPPSFPPQDRVQLGDPSPPVQSPPVRGITASAGAASDPHDGVYPPAPFASTGPTTTAAAAAAAATAATGPATTAAATTKSFPETVRRLRGAWKVHPQRRNMEETSSAPTLTFQPYGVGGDSPPPSSPSDSLVPAVSAEPHEAEKTPSLSHGR